MTDYTLTIPRIAAYERHLLNEERSRGTIEKYLRDVNAFSAWLGGRQVTKELASEWKAHLLSSGYAPVSVNAMLSALNGLFRDGRRELTKNEYERLVSTASALGKERLALLMEAVCATGIRISELNRLTVEAAKRGRAEISLKGKIREILLPGKLCRKLLKYAKKEKIASGAIFRTRSGREISRRQVWTEMKALCGAANVEPSKVFPHNLRHLFATAFSAPARTSHAWPTSSAIRASRRPGYTSPSPVRSACVNWTGSG